MGIARHGNVDRFKITNGLKTKKTAQQLFEKLALNPNKWNITTLSGRSAGGKLHAYYALESRTGRVSDREANKLGKLLGVSINPPSRHKDYDDSVQNLQRIVNSIGRKRAAHTANSFSSKRQPSTYNERELQNRANAYAEKHGVRVVPMNANGYPDNLYVRRNNSILGAVEWKDPLKGSLERNQAARILELLKDGWNVRVLNDFKSFKKWLKQSIKKA